MRRQRRGVLQVVLAGNEVLTAIVHRHHELLVPQVTIQQARPGGNSRSVGAVDDFLDQLIDHLVLDASEVLAAFLIGRRRTKIVIQLIAGAG